MRSVRISLAVMALATTLIAVDAAKPRASQIQTTRVASLSPQPIVRPQNPPATQAPPKTPPVQTPPTTQAPAGANPATQGTQQTPPQPTKPPASTQPAARASVMFFVTTMSGAPVADAKVTLIGPAEREGTTSTEGTLRMTNLRAGTYRARFDAKDCILFEKEVAARAGQLVEVEVTLNPAPKPVEPPPPPPPPPLKKVEEPSQEPPGEVALQSVPDWIERNLLGRNEAQKVSTLARVPGAVVGVLQVRDGIADRSHREADELLYLIAGEGALRIAGRVQAITPGWLAVLPRGTVFSIERRARNPLIFLSVIAPARGADVQQP